MPDIPSVSIVLPFRNASATIDEALQSVMRQSLTDWELLAIDDASTDGSAAIVQALNEPRVRLLRNPRPGLVNALNLGLAEARAALIARMDGDDVMRPRRLEKQLAAMRAEPALSLCASQARLFPDAHIKAGYRAYIDWQNRLLRPAQIDTAIFTESPFVHPSVMFRRDHILAAGGYRHGDFPEDYELWLRLHARGARMRKLAEVLLDWRDGPRRLSRTDPRCSRAAFDHIKLDYLMRDPRLLRHRDNFVCWGAGRKTRRRSDPLLANGFRPRAWIDIDAKKIGNRIDGIPVVSADWLREHREHFVLCWISNHGARAGLQAFFAELGLREGRDYLMLAGYA
ncbi:MAG TPA: glycosyltransferase [Chromatiaceae bacterium]|nr:glycosyltransferase [Chromatiaceae bacterium]